MTDHAGPAAADEPTSTLARALSLFDALVDLPDTEREAALRGEPRAIRDRVHALLSADRRADGSAFLAGSALKAIPAPPRAAVEAGARYGAWTLLRTIGEGGMGQVWLAERDLDMYSRRAAVKLLGRGAGGPAALARFVREGQILARLTHPNVAALIDAGVQEGERYLVLEYVAGLRIDDWCDERRLTVRDRVRLFLQVCKAVAHAHGNFVVHRDLKPSNVLVTDEGTVKLLDFGVAKLLDGSDGAAEPTELTRAGGVGMTPEFAAPEQVVGGAITAATDVHALGLVLYELLTGRRPFARGHGSPAAVLHAILEVEPRRASVAVAEDRDAERARRLAVNRSITPARLADAVRGDLDNILGKALKKPPTERYGTVREFASDLQRWLDDLPVEARSDSIPYRTLKFVRRHRYAVGTATLAALALVLGATVALWQAHEARLQAQRAEREAATATAVKEFVLDLFEEGDVNNPGGKIARDATVEKLLDNGSARIERSLAAQPEVRAELLDTLGILQLQFEAPAKAEQLYRQLHATRAQLYGEADERTLDALVSVSTALRNQSRYADADALCADVLRRLDAAGVAAPRVRGRALAERAYANYRRTPPDAAAAARYGQAAVQLLSALPADEFYVDALYNLGRAYEGLERHADAASSYARGIEAARRLTGDDTTRVHGGRQMRARVLGASGRLREAERELAAAAAGFRRMVGESHRYYVDAASEHAEILAAWGRWREAQPLLRNAYAKKVELRGRESGLAVRTQLALARSLVTSGDPAAARDVIDAYLAIPVASRRADADALAFVTRARSLLAQRRADAAAADLALAAQALAPAPQDGARAARRALHLATAEMSIARGDATGAARALDAIAAAVDAAPGTATPPHAVSALRAEVAALRGDADAASRLAAAALAELEADPERAGAHEAEAALLLLQSRLATAGTRCAPARAALAIHLRTQQPGSSRLAATRAAAAGCGT